MATAVTMDTLQISRRLRDAGATEPIAETMAKTFAGSTAVVREDLATRADLEALHVATKADIVGLRADMDAHRAATKADMLIATIGATVTLIKALG